MKSVLLALSQSLLFVIQPDLIGFYILHIIKGIILQHIWMAPASKVALLNIIIIIIKEDQREKIAQENKLKCKTHTKHC